MDPVDRHFKQMASTLRVDRHVEARAPPTQRINYDISSPFTPGRYIPATLNNLLMPRTEFSRSNGFSSLNAGRMWRDNTLHSATRQKQWEETREEREARQREMKKNQEDQWSRRMEKEVLLRQRALQRKLRLVAKQSEMQPLPPASSNMAPQQSITPQKPTSPKANTGSGVAQYRGHGGVLTAEKNIDRDQDTFKRSKNEKDDYSSSLFITESIPSPRNYDINNNISVSPIKNDSRKGKGNSNQDPYPIPSGNNNVSSNNQTTTAVLSTKRGGMDKIQTSSTTTSTVAVVSNSNSTKAKLSETSAKDNGESFQHKHRKIQSSNKPISVRSEIEKERKALEAEEAKHLEMLKPVVSDTDHGSMYQEWRDRNKVALTKKLMSNT